MKGAATGDLHLGKRRFAATRDGRNCHEMDIETAWLRTCDDIATASPDLVTVAGDVFDSIRPTFHAVRAWQRGVRRILDRTDAHIVVIPGNHDSPRTTESLSPVLVIADEPRVHVVEQPKRLILNIARTGERVAVACFPFAALTGEETYRLDPDPTAAVNVLLLHAAVRSSVVDGLPRFYAGETAIDVGREAERWSVCHAGDYHDFIRLHPTALAFYAGSPERTTSDIWHEVSPKGFVLYDTETNDLTFREIPTRRVLDLAPRDCIPSYLDATQLYGHAEVNAAVQGLLESPETQDAIVRLVAEGFPRHDRDRIDWSLVRELKHRALHFELVLKYGAADNIDQVDRRMHAVPLIDQARAFLADDPEDVRECAISYLETREAA